MTRTIYAFETALLSEDPIHFSKLDIKDEFRRIVCLVGEKWNFAYVMLNNPEAPTELVITPDLQMGWILSPFFFHVAS